MKLNEMLPSKFLKQEDVPDEVVVTVQALKKENMARDDEEPRYKWTVKFAEYDKPMALNSTNLKRMFKSLGDDTTEWKGGKLKLYADPDVEFKGEIVGGLRVRAIPRTTNGKRAKTDDDINGDLADATGGQPDF